MGKKCELGLGDVARCRQLKLAKHTIIHVEQLLVGKEMVASKEMG